MKPVFKADQKQDFSDSLKIDWFDRLCPVTKVQKRIASKTEINKRDRRLLYKSEDWPHK